MQIPDENQLQWVPIQKGALALSHRPKANSFSSLQRQGCTHVLTLLSEREGALLMGESVKQAGLQWLWLPLENATPPHESQTQKIIEFFQAIAALLAQGSYIMIHCAAGIHRTGMIANAFLRFLGYSSEEAFEYLHQLREITANSMGIHRREWGEQFAVLFHP